MNRYHYLSCGIAAIAIAGMTGHEPVLPSPQPLEKIVQETTAPPPKIQKYTPQRPARTRRDINYSAHTGNGYHVLFGHEKRGQDMYLFDILLQLRLNRDTFQARGPAWVELIVRETRQRYTLHGGNGTYTGRLNIKLTGTKTLELYDDAVPFPRLIHRFEFSPRDY